MSLDLLIARSLIRKPEIDLAKAGEFDRKLRKISRPLSRLFG